jgi:hypothetical protein
LIAYNKQVIPTTALNAALFLKHAEVVHILLAIEGIDVDFKDQVKCSSHFRPVQANDPVVSAYSLAERR